MAVPFGSCRRGIKCLPFYTKEIYQLELTKEQLEQLQKDLAKAKTAEREAAEKTAVTRAKLDKLEQQLADILSGKGGEK